MQDDGKEKQVPRKRSFWTSLYTGLEITDYSVRAVQLSKDRHHQWMVERSGEWPLPPGVVVKGQVKQQDALVAELFRLVKDMGAKRKPVHLALPSQHAIVRQLLLPQLPPKALAKLVRYEVQQQNIFPFHDVIYDFVQSAEPAHQPPVSEVQSVLAPVLPTSGNREQQRWDRDGLSQAASSDRSWRQEALDETASAIAMPQTTSTGMSGAPIPTLAAVAVIGASLGMMQPYITAIRKTGLRLLSVENKALSLFRMLGRMDSTSVKGTFFAIHLQQDLAELNLYHQGLLMATRTMPISIPADPHPFGLTASEQMFQAFEQIAAELDKSFNYFRYSMGYREVTLSHILLSGDMPDLAGFAQYMRGRYPLKVELLRIGESIPWRSEALNATVYAVPIGLALKGDRS